MSNKPKTAIQLSPERQALAARIEADQPVILAVETARQRVERARHFLAEAQDRQRSAEQALAEARDMVMAGSEPDGGEMRRLRQAVEDANEDAGLARAALKGQEEELKDAQRSAEYAADRIERAAGQVIALEADKAYTVALAAAKKAARLAWAAHYIAQQANHFDGTRHQLMGRADTLNPGIVWGNDYMGAERAKSEVRAPWIEALAALKSDPAAPLPEIVQ